MRRALLAVAVAATFALAGCGFGGVTVSGSLMLNDAFSPTSPMGRGEHPCVGTGGYSDIAEGASVTVYNAAGAIVATGGLAGGQPIDQAGACMFPFEIADVPRGDFYQVEVSHRGRVTYSQADLDAGQVTLTLG